MMRSVFIALIALAIGLAARGESHGRATRIQRSLV
jgi:hypothetical protein